MGTTTHEPTTSSNSLNLVHSKASKAFANLCGNLAQFNNKRFGNDLEKFATKSRKRFDGGKKTTTETRENSSSEASSSSSSSSSSEFALEWSPPNGGGTGEYPQKRIQD
jgi:hypothetical protein